MSRASSSQTAGKPAATRRVELGGRRRLHPLAVVQAFQVDDVDGACLRELGDEVVRPLVTCIELEAKFRIELAPLANRALGDDEAHGLRLAARYGCEGRVRLAQREIERGRLEAPGPIAGLIGDEVGKALERVPTREWR